jgi:hypothetical protein
VRQDPAEMLAVMALFPEHVDPWVREFWVKQARQQAARPTEAEGLGEREAFRGVPCREGAGRARAARHRAGP